MRCSCCSPYDSSARRGFLKTVGAFSVALAFDGLARAEGLSSTTAHPYATCMGDLAVFNSNIITLDKYRPSAQALLIKAGRIVAIGDNRTIADLSARVRSFDAQGRTIIPGFVDNHCHIEQTCITADKELDLRQFKSIAEMTSHIRACAVKRPKGDTLVFIGGNFPNGVTEQRWLTREDLDQATSDHPVMVILVWHASVLNTLAWKRTGYWQPGTEGQVFWRDGSPRLGSYIHRGPDGHPSGVATEMWDYRPHYEIKTYKEAMARHFSEWFLSKGLTSITTLPNAAPEQWIALQELQRAGGLPARLRVYPTVPQAMTLDEIEKFGTKSGYGSAMMKFGGVKIFADDGLDGMGQARADLKWETRHLTDTLARCQIAGLETIIHVVTEEGWEQVMSAIEAAQRKTSARSRHRIDHISPTDPVQIRRAKDAGIALGITPRRQPPNQPQARGRYVWNHRYKSLLNEGIPTILVLDVARTGGDYHPMQGIANVISDTENGGSAAAGESISFDQALRMWTIYPAALNGEGQDKGTIEVGKFGDLAVLSSDPTAKPADQVYAIKTEATICGGELVYGS